MMPEFFQTVMGRAFYEGTVPRIAKALERIADTLQPQDPSTSHATDVPWVVARGTMVGFRCKRCNHDTLVSLPVSIDFLVAMSRTLADEHRNCVEEVSHDDLTR